MDMLMRQSRLAKNITHDYLTCSICLNRFREPRTLPCEHSFCLQCLAVHIKDTQIDRTFTCPIDRRQFRTADDTCDPWESAASFQSDTLLSGLLKALNESVNLENTEKHSIKKEKLEFFCFGCKEILTAERAVEYHRRPTCECVTIKKAFERILPEIECLSRDLESMVVKTSKMKYNSKRQSDSAPNNGALNEIENFEVKLDRFYSQCKNDLHSLRTKLRNVQTPKDEDDIENISGDVQRVYEDFSNAQENENIDEVLKKYLEISNCIPELQKKIVAIPNLTSRKNSYKFVPNESLLEFIESKTNCGHIHSIELSYFKATADEHVFNYYDVAIVGKYLIVIDGENGLLKRYLNHDHSSVDSLRLSHVCRVAVLSNDEIAVTRFGKKKITLVTIGRKMYVRGHIRTKRSYIGIAWLNDAGFAVSYYDGEYPPGLEIVSNEGKLVKSIQGHRYNLNDNMPLFVCPMFMTTTTSGDIIVCDYSETKKILCFNQHLELLWFNVLTSMPCSATCDRYSIYVTLPANNEIIALRQENGEKIRTIVEELDGLIKPYAISWNSNVMAVTEDESETIHFIHL